MQLEKLVKEATVNPSVQVGLSLLHEIKNVVVDKKNYSLIQQLKALAYYCTQEYTHAISILEELLTLNDSSEKEKIIANLVLLLPFVGRTEEANDYGCQLLAFDRQNPVYWDNIGYVFFNSGQYAQALQQYERGMLTAKFRPNTVQIGHLYFRAYHAARMMEDRALSHQYLCKRYECDDYRETLRLPYYQHQVLTIWKGEDTSHFTNKKILLWREKTEGVGDDLLNIHYVAQMDSHFFEKNSYFMTIDERLKNIAKRVLPQVHFIYHKDEAPSQMMQHFDIAVLSLHIPYFLWPLEQPYPLKKCLARY